MKPYQITVVVTRKVRREFTQIRNEVERFDDEDAWKARLAELEAEGFERGIIETRARKVEAINREVAPDGE